MKKVVLIASCVLLVFLLSMPYWFGIRAERIYEAEIQNISNSGRLALSSKKYNRGWFRSTAETLVTVKGSAGESLQKLLTSSSGKPDTPFQFLLSHSIHHGPISFQKRPVSLSSLLTPVQATVETRFVADSEVKRKIGKIFDIASSSRMDTIVYLDGHGENYFTIPEAHHTVGEPEAASVSWESLQGLLTFTSDLNRFEASFSAPDLKISDNQSEFSITGVHAEADLRKGPYDLLLGQISLEIGLINFADHAGGARPFLAKKSEMVYSARIVGNDISNAVKLQFEEMNIEGKNLSKGILEIEIRNLNAEFFAKLRREFEELEEKRQRLSDEAMQMVLLGKLMEIIPELAKNSPQIELIRLNFGTDKGTFESYAKVSFGNDFTSSSTSFDFFSMLLNNVKMEARCTIPAPLLRDITESQIKQDLIASQSEGTPEDMDNEQINELAADASARQIQALVDQNYFTEEGGTYKFNVSYDQGQFLLNGRPVSPTFLLNPVR